MDEVLSEPIILSYGKKENELVINIDSKTGVDFTWVKETLSKRFWDAFESGAEIVRTIFNAIAASLRYITDKIGWTKPSEISQ